MYCGLTCGNDFSNIFSTFRDVSKGVGGEGLIGGSWTNNIWILQPLLHYILQWVDYEPASYIEKVHIELYYEKYINTYKYDLKFKWKYIIILLLLKIIIIWNMFIYDMATTH